MEQAWWKEAIVYQIYPKSFRDSNGDGTGDIPGILEKLDYLKDLGVNVLWISPVYCSPMDDNGYDISDYYHVDPSFGTDADLDHLIEEAGKMGMKVLMDLVVNHTSDEHPWFQKALAQPDGEYGDYYIIREGHNGYPPDNLRSYFGGSPWERIGDSNKYYFHSFGKKQPDLNWDNKMLRKEIYDMMNYWLDKGLGGFRVDAIGNIKKNLCKNHYEPDGEDGLCHVTKAILNQPGIEQYLDEMKRYTLLPHNAMTVAEVSVPKKLLPQFAGERGFFSMVFDFSYTDIDVPDTGEWYKPVPWTVKDLREHIFHSQLDTEAVGWGAVYLENHDQPRSVNKYIPEGDINYYSTTMLAGMYMMLRGTPFIYQGQELGMGNVEMEKIEDYDDLATHDQYERAIRTGMEQEKAWKLIAKRSRDNSRTPMQWDDSNCAGFTAAGHTWLKVNDNYRACNVKREEQESQSVLKFYRQLITLRKDSAYRDIIIHGKFNPYETEWEDVITYVRSLEGRRLLVINNFSSDQRVIELPSKDCKVILSNYRDWGNSGEEYLCRGYETVVLYQKSSFSDL